MPSTSSSSSAQSPSAFNLTKAISIGRVSLKVVVGGLVLLMVGRFALNSAIDLYRSLNPPPPPPPTVGFGMLPPIVFSESTASTPSTYTLELPTNQLPFFSDRAKVFLMPKASQSLLSLDEGKATAARLGFRSEPDALDTINYRWKNFGTLNETLELNLVTENMTYVTDYLARPELQGGSELPSSFDAVNSVKRFFSSADLLPADVATNSGATQYLKIVGGSLREAVSLSDAQLVGVELARTPIDSVYQPITSSGTSGTLTALVALSEGRNPTIIEAERLYFPIDYSLVETYPIRTTDDAWKVLKAGEGFIAASARNDTATIRSVALGYYESAEYQPFYQPVYIFYGDNGFVGLVPAVDPRYITKTSNPETSPNSQPNSNIITL